MPADSASTRRDPRYELRPGAASIEIPHPSLPGGRIEAPLTRISVAGLAFQLENDGTELPDGTAFQAVTIRVSGCQLRGEVLVRSRRPVTTGTTEFGGLFYPASSDLEDRLMTLVAGIEAAQRR